MQKNDFFLNLNWSKKNCLLIKLKSDKFAVKENWKISNNELQYSTSLMLNKITNDLSVEQSVL